MTRTPTTQKSGWIVNTIYSDASCSGDTLQFFMYPVERCIPIVRYDSATGSISTKAYKKYSCGLSKIGVSYYSNNICTRLQTSRPVEIYPTTCNAGAVEDNYYYNSQVTYSSKITCSSVRNYTSLIVPSSNVANNRYVIQATYIDTTCAANKIASYDVYRDQRCYNMNDPDNNGDVQSYEFVYPSLNKYRNVKCDDENLGSSGTSEFLSNTQQCYYNPKLASGVETTALSNKWFPYQV
jgi:hypothetical protein